MNRFLFNKVIYYDIYDEDKKMNKKDYPSAIRKLRAKLNISQQELADMLGVSFPSVNDGKMGIMNQLL